MFEAIGIKLDNFIHSITVKLSLTKNVVHNDNSRIQNNYYNVLPPRPDPALIEIPDEADVDLIIALGLYVDVILTANVPKTKVHLEFSITNGHVHQSAIKFAQLKINEGIAHFNKFYKKLPDSKRRYDDMESFPLIISSNGIIKAYMEFENVEITLLKKGENKCELILITDRDRVVSKKFTFVVDASMESVFVQLNESFKNTGMAQVVPVQLKES